MPNKQKPPRMADPLEQFMEVGRRIYGPNFGYQWLKNIFDYPIASDSELILHYLRGGAGPFIDLKIYVELGVGWYLKPEGFADEEEGVEAKKLVDEELEKRDFYTSMIQLAMFWHILGRAALVKTYTVDGKFYYSEKEGITGLDVINPMTLNMESIKKVMSDTTGTELYKQEVTLPDGTFDTVEFEQDRVIYITNNAMTRNSPLGTSDLECALTDLRTLARFPYYRDEMGDLYSTLLLVITTDAEKIAGTEFGQKLRESVTEAQKYLDDTATFYREMRGKGNIIANYDWENVNPVSFAGREVKLVELELQTLRSIAFKMGIPLELLLYAEHVNRATLETLADTFVSRMEKGIRKFVFTPIIQNIADEILRQNDFADGHFTVKYKPFLPKNLLAAAEIIRSIWPTGSISKPEIREQMDLPPKINLGGKEWEGMDPMPIPSLGGGMANLQNIKSFLLEKGLIK